MTLVETGIRDCVEARAALSRFGIPGGLLIRAVGAARLDLILIHTPRPGDTGIGHVGVPWTGGRPLRHKPPGQRKKKVTEASRQG